MFKHWLIDLIGHVSGLSDAQLRQIEKALPASKALIDIFIRARPTIEQAQKRGVAELLPHPSLTRNQVELMQIDTTASDNLPGFRVLGISPRSLEEELQVMLKQSK